MAKLLGLASPSQPARKAKRVSREEGIINSLRHLENGDEVMGCVSHCRFGEERHTWHECLERCVDHPMMRDSMMRMLPDEHHAAPSVDTPLPRGILISDEVKTKYQLHRRQR